MEKTTYAYKIRNKTTGLYSTGGTTPSWSAHGKAWPSMHQFKLHLGLFHSCVYDPTAKGEYRHVYKLPKGYEDSEIVVLKCVMTTTNMETYKSVKDFVTENKLNRDKDIVNSPQ